MQTITVCTDAGHKNMYNESCATWAAYIRTPSQTIKVSGVITRPVKGSTHAELYAIANALHIINENYDLSKYRLILYSDSEQAIRNHLDNSISKRPAKDMKEVYDKYISPHIVKAHSYEARHVRAHLPKSQWKSQSAKYFMQHWCDEEVHRIMKIAVKDANRKNKIKRLCFNGKKSIIKVS